MTEETKEARIKVDALVAAENISVIAACKKLGVTASRYYYKSPTVRKNAKNWKKMVKKEQKRIVAKRRDFTPTQIIVAKDKRVNIVIMKGDQDAVAEIAKSLSWMGDING